MLVVKNEDLNIQLSDVESDGFIVTPMTPDMAQAMNTAMKIRNIESMDKFIEYAIKESLDDVNVSGKNETDRVENVIRDSICMTIRNVLGLN